LENLAKMDKFLDICPKLKQEDINHLKRSLTHNEIESAISLPKNKSPRPDGFSTESYQTFKELIPTLLNRFHKLEMSTSFYEVTIILFPKPDKDISKKENYRPISLMNINAKILNKIMVN
jgi:hypothetical protein